MNSSETNTATHRTLILVLLAIPALAVAYYFVVALPRYNQGQLALERDKFSAQQAEKRSEAEARTLQDKSAAERAQAREIATDQAKQRAQATAALNASLLDGCKLEAAKQQDDYIHLNGTPMEGKPDTYSAPMYIWDEARKRKKEAVDDCYQRYQP